MLKGQKISAKSWIFRDINCQFQKDWILYQAVLPKLGGYIPTGNCGVVFPHSNYNHLSLNIRSLNYYEPFQKFPFLTLLDLQLFINHSLNLGMGLFHELSKNRTNILTCLRILCRAKVWNFTRLDYSVNDGNFKIIIKGQIWTYVKCMELCNICWNMNRQLL